MNLHIGLAVLQGVGIANRVERQLSSFSDRNKSETKFVRHRCAKKKTARVDAHHFLSPEIDGFFGEKVNYLPKQICVSQDRSNVSEQDPWLWEVRNRANRRLDLFEIDSIHE